MGWGGGHSRAAVERTKLQRSAERLRGSQIIFGQWKREKGVREREQGGGVRGTNRETCEDKKRQVGG